MALVAYPPQPLVSPPIAACAGAQAAAFEPSLATVPGTRQVVAAWQLGPFAGGPRSSYDAGSQTVVVDTGTRTVPVTRGCEGPRLTQPLVSAGAGGWAYVSALQLAADGSGAVVVSADGGAPRVVARDEGGTQVDGPSAAADPGVPGRAYVAWSVFGSTAIGTDRIAVARTDDGGTTWSTPATALDASLLTGADLQHTVSAVLTTGRVLVVVYRFSRRLVDGGPLEILALHSDDHGRTWSRAVPVGINHNAYPKDADGDLSVEPGLPQLAVSRGGRVAVVWTDDRTSGPSAVVVAASEDGGATWGAPATVATPGRAAAAPAVAVGDDGTIAAAWTDLDADRPGDAAITATPRWATSGDGGRTWAVRALATFDARGLPVRAGQTGDREIGLGFHQGLAATGSSFRLATTEPGGLRQRILAAADPRRPRVTAARSGALLHGRASDTAPAGAVAGVVAVEIRVRGRAARRASVAADGRWSLRVPSGRAVVRARDLAGNRSRAVIVR